MNTYMYEGPVNEFGKCIDKKWAGYTKANSESKAKSNLMYRYKVTHGKMPSAKIELPGNLVLV